MTRVFVAIELPELAKEKISKIEKCLLDTDSRINPVNPDYAHITLKFIGDVEDKQLESIKKSLFLIKYSKYHINLKGLRLNSKKSPRIVWIEGYDNKETTMLVEIIEDALYPLGIEKEDRSYKLHATVARIKRWHNSLMPAIKLFEDEEICDFEVCGFKLKKSTLTPKGPVYEDILEVSF